MEICAHLTNKIKIWKIRLSLQYFQVFLVKGTDKVRTKLTFWWLSVFSGAVTLDVQKYEILSDLLYKIISVKICSWNYKQQSNFDKKCALLCGQNCSCWWLDIARSQAGYQKAQWWHDDVIKWKHFPRNWPFVRGIHRSRWIHHPKASDAELWCFLWFASQ